jgi:acyl dehydratase
MFGGPTGDDRAAMFYVDQMLLKSFTMGSFYGGRLLLRSIEPFRPGDTVTFQGELTSLSEITTTDAGGSPQLVEYRTRSINQREDLVNLSEAALVLKGLAADK